MSEKKKGRPSKGDSLKKKSKKSEKKGKQGSSDNPKKRKKESSPKVEKKKEPEVKVVREAKSRFIIIQPGSQNLR
jgi:hypothetical protein